MVLNYKRELVFYRFFETLWNFSTLLQVRNSIDQIKAMIVLVFKATFNIFRKKTYSIDSAGL